MGEHKLPPTIGQIVRRLRRERGLSQKQIEYLSGGKISGGWIGNLETDRIASPNHFRLAALAELLGTNAAAIFEEAGIIASTDQLGPKAIEFAKGYEQLSLSMQQIANRILRELIDAEYTREAEHKKNSKDQVPKQQDDAA